MRIDEAISRRELLKRGGMVAGAALAGAPLLTACAPESPEPQEAPPSSPPAAEDIDGAQIKVSTYGGFFEENFGDVSGVHRGDRGRGRVDRGADLRGVGRAAPAGRRGRHAAAVRRLDALRRRDPAGDQRRHPRDLRDADIPKPRASPRATSAPTTPATSPASAPSRGTSRSSPTPTASPRARHVDGVLGPEWENELALLNNAANAYLLEITAPRSSTATTSSRRRTAWWRS